MQAHATHQKPRRKRFREAVFWLFMSICCWTRATEMVCAVRLCWVEFEFLLRSRLAAADVYIHIQYILLCCFVFHDTIVWPTYYRPASTNTQFSIYMSNMPTPDSHYIISDRVVRWSDRWWANICENVNRSTSAVIVGSQMNRQYLMFYRLVYE